MRLSRVLFPVVLLTCIFFLNFIARQITGPSLPEIERVFHLSHTQIGLFILLMGTGFCFSQIGAAFLAARWGYKRCILISLWGSAAAAVVVAGAGSILVLYFGFLGLGMAGGLYVPSGIALITVLVQPRDWGKAMGIHEVAPSIALISVPFIATAAVFLGSWRWGFYATALALAILGCLYWRIGVDSQKRPSSPNITRILEIIRQPSFWQLCVLLSMAVGVETGVYTMTPLYLVNERGFDLSEANQLLGLSRIPSVALVLLSGWLTDRLSPTKAVAAALAVTGCALIGMGLGSAGVLVICVFLLAAAAACLFPPMLSMASAISTTENRALTLSLSIAVAPVIGSGLLPAAIAFTADIFSFAVGFTGTGLLLLAGIGLVKRQ